MNNLFCAFRVSINYNFCVSVGLGFPGFPEANHAISPHITITIIIVIIAIIVVKNAVVHSPTYGTLPSPLRSPEARARAQSLAGPRSSRASLWQGLQRVKAFAQLPPPSRALLLAWETSRDEGLRG